MLLKGANAWLLQAKRLATPAIKTLSYLQPLTQALCTTRLAGGKTLVQAGHVSPRFWEITIETQGRQMWHSSSKEYKECE